MPRVAVLNTDGSHEFKLFSKLEDYQRAVGGNISIYPHSRSCDAEVMVYVNDEALMLNLPTNGAAWSLMAEVFEYQIPLPGIWGPVVMLGRDEKSLSRYLIRRIDDFYAQRNGEE